MRHSKLIEIEMCRPLSLFRFTFLSAGGVLVSQTSPVGNGIECNFIQNISSVNMKETNFQPAHTHTHMWEATDNHRYSAKELGQILSLCMDQDERKYIFNT